MKLFVGWVASAGVLFTAAAADAQTLVPYRPGVAVVASDLGGPYAAMPPEMGPRYELLPPREIFAIARESGFAPLGALQQRGLVYTLAAIDQDGEDGRLVIDARSGRIIRFMPASRMGGRMGEEVVTSYGPVGAYRPDTAAPPPYVRDDRRAPPSAALPNNVLPHVASRSPAVPLPKAAPPRAVASPAKPVAPAPAVAVAPPVAPTPAAAAVQQAVVAPKPDPVRVIPLDAAPAAPSVATAPVEAKPSTVQPTKDMPPVQGLE